MIEISKVGVLRELVALGLIADKPDAQRLSTYTADRRDRQNRSSWRVNLPDGRPARLILGPDLSELSEKQTAFAHVCPDLVPAPMFHQPLVYCDAFAELFVEGTPLESATNQTPSQIQAGFARARTMLGATTRSSTEANRLAEWLEWTKSIASLALWTPIEKSLLENTIWPGLYPLLCEASPAIRWSNGDFTSANLLLDQSGNVHLIDHEFALETHFYTEDAARFHALSSSARQRPGLFSGALPLPGPAWHLFFWLRQLKLDSAHNSAAYLDRMRPVRLGVIRRLSEMILGCQLKGWSVDPAPLHHRLEYARWEQTASTALRVSGWCHVPAATLNSIIVSQGDHLLATGAPSTRPDVQEHFSGAINARASGFSLAIPLRDAETSLILSALTDDGTLLPFHSFRASDLPGRGPWVEDYTRWAALYDPDPMAPALKTPGPLFSVLVPVYNTPLTFLRACLESVRGQHYPLWELCIVDDGSSDRAIPEYLRQLAGTDPRIRVRLQSANAGIARASNEALAMAAGSFVILLDHDDLLRPHALLEFARYLRNNLNTDALYSDEDKLSPEGQRIAPSFKPDFSPEHLLGVMYIGHALCVRTSVARAVGGFDPVYDGMQDYEFFLRITEQTRLIGHVPRILYHWRQSPGSSSLHGNIKGNIGEKQAAAVRAHLRRQGRTEQVTSCGHHRLQLRATEPSPSVEIVRTTECEDPMLALTRAASISPADVFVLLVNEPLSTSEHWLRDLATLAERADSGLIAPLLLSPNGLVQTSGWTSGPAGTAPIMGGFDPSGDGYCGSLLCTREVVAVSPVCFAIKRTLIPIRSSVGEPWLDYCQRLRESGLFHRVCSTARVQVPAAADLPSKKRGTSFPQDPFLNPHFNPLRADYALAKPPSHLHAVLWHLDTPPATMLSNGFLHLRGWCFSAEERCIRAVRLRAGNLTLHGVTGLNRPDVKEALPEAPNNYTGFEIRGKLPIGRSTLFLEAGLSDGSWAVLMTYSVEVKRQLIPLWLAGSTGKELMNYQMPAFAAHPARKLRPGWLPPALSPKNQRPRLSIVTPSYQQARFLEETMRSVLGQRVADCHYVVQDGGSTDGSVDIIRRFAGDEPQDQSQAQTNAGSSPPAPDARPRLMAWESARDQGQTDAIARGFAKTTGGPEDLMAWINSDDFYLPGALEYVADYFARHPNVDVIYGHRIVVDEESQEVGRWFLPKHDDEVLRLNDFVPQETMFWRRRIWNRVGGLDASFQFAMDWDLLLRFQAAGAKIARVPYFLACFRIHPAQKTSVSIHDIGQREIDLLRARVNGRTLASAELENSPALIRYLRRSAFIELMWQLGIRLA